MSGSVNPAFETNELDMLESGHRANSSKNTALATNNGSVNFLQAGCDKLSDLLSKHRLVCKLLLLTLFNILILIYFVFATLYWKNNNFEKGYDWCHGYGLLIILLVIIYGGIFYNFIVKRFLGEILAKCTRPFYDRVSNVRSEKYGSIVIRSTIYTCIFVAIIIFLIFDSANSRDRLFSLIGVISLMSFGWLFSKHRTRIKWQPVLNGLILQFLFGLLTIRWEVGRAILQCIADKVAAFLNFVKSGAGFIFSDQLVADGVFAFSVLPVIYYFSFFIQILYYLGVMQWVILKMGRVLQIAMGTSICESVACAANIFLGMSESPLVIKPYLNKLTTSELHTIMCSGFAMVSGTVLAAYIDFGANPSHLITASLMAAPAALCYSKLFYPETETSLITKDNVRLEKSKDTSLMDAASKGALAGIPLVLGIIANIVAFVSFIALVNSLLSWAGSLVGYEDISFEWILSKVFMPLSWIMGVPWERCEDVATLIGLKTVVNEFVAYKKLGEFKKQGRLFGRAEAIATFAICGFANPSSVGIMLGMLSSLAPDRKENITSSVLRAFVAGSAVCFLTASIAGILTDETVDIAVNSTMPVNVTNSTNGTTIF